MHQNFNLNDSMLCEKVKYFNTFKTYYTFEFLIKRIM